jgi:hypothetical protein
VSCDACKRIPVLTRKPCQYCGRLNVEAELALKQLRALDKEESESASLRARLAEAEAEREHAFVLLGVANADLAQAREELAALREVAEAAGHVARAYGWQDPHPSSLAGGLMRALSKLSALPGGEAKVPSYCWAQCLEHGKLCYLKNGQHPPVEPAPNPPAAPSAECDCCNGRTVLFDSPWRCRACGTTYLNGKAIAQSAHRADSGGEGAK